MYYFVAVRTYEKMRSLFFVWLSILMFGPIPLFSLQVKDPKCRYRVQLPVASWHTAYDACAKNNRTLVTITSLTEMYLMDLVLQEVDSLFVNSLSYSHSTGVWIKAFLRSSNNESMLENCKSFDPQLPVKIRDSGPNDMFCLYYNKTEQTFITDDCSEEKMFICESNDEEIEACMTESAKSTLKDGSPFNFCNNGIHNSATSELCESICFFVHSADSYTVSSTKPLSEWCPELTEEVIQEKIGNIQKNLTVNPKETNQYIRTLTSAPDDRQSAKNIGIVGVTVISVVFGIVILSDCINIVKGVQNKCTQVKDK
ncbi:uncharacterized protein LOC133193573 [Saccostrea echinata]|uniref:uncharacterized protein LOC133193573 n=1 Tax=Saccostrea echinata TaxID=191078 RepID=UPI002A813DE4|nr:uncharacterized protein LOC133193573 [Saccostrea echinata]